jgi:hypothetical protein
MKERRKQNSRLFTPEFFAGVRAFFRNENQTLVAEGRARLEKVAAILNDPIALEKAGGVVKEMQGIYIAKGENAELLRQFSQEFDLLAFPQKPEGAYDPLFARPAL